MRGQSDKVGRGEGSRDLAGAGWRSWENLRLLAGVGRYNQASSDSTYTDNIDYNQFLTTIMAPKTTVFDSEHIWSTLISCSYIRTQTNLSRISSSRKCTQPPIFPANILVVSWVNQTWQKQ
jgi:hypothetical protein